jgi:predicted RNA-binding Zn-ribbon protein involved in translation (DUF1610 family)
MTAAAPRAGAVTIGRGDTMPDVNRKAPNKYHWQTILFPKDVDDWKKEEAREKWLVDHDCIKSGYHETAHYHRYRQYDPESDKFNYFHKTIDENVNAVCGVPKEDNEEGSATVYQCECVSCGYKQSSTQHCRDIKCPKCGGQMRRADRPGSGR